MAHAGWRSGGWSGEWSVSSGPWKADRTGCLRRRRLPTLPPQASPHGRGSQYRVGAGRRRVLRDDLTKDDAKLFCQISLPIAACRSRVIRNRGGLPGFPFAAIRDRAVAAAGGIGLTGERCQDLAQQLHSLSDLAIFSTIRNIISLAGQPEQAHDREADTSELAVHP